MRRLLVLVVGLVFSVCTAVSAAEKPGLQRARGGFKTTTTVISGTAELVTGVSFSCAGTACVVGLYDTDSIGATTSAAGFWEDGAAANTGKYVAFDPPIRTKTGVTLVSQDGNLNGLVVFTKQPTP